MQHSFYQKQSYITLAALKKRDWKKFEMERSLNLNEVSDWIKFQMERGLILKEVWYEKKFEMKKSLRRREVWDGMSISRYKTELQTY